MYHYETLFACFTFTSYFLSLTSGGMTEYPPTDDSTDLYETSTPPVNRTTEQDIRNVITNVVEKIDPHFIPVSDHSEPLELGAEFTLLSMTNFDEISGELSIVASINLTWKGSNLPAWDPSQLGGKETYALSVKDIWTPRLLLLNPAKAVTDLAALSDRARITSDRTVIWQVISGIMASCAVDVRNFPFDQQVCSINVAVWGYDTREITVLGTQTSSDKWFVENSAWSLDNTETKGVNSDTAPFLRITMYISRRSAYFLINVLLPPVLLSVLSPCVFLLPAASGERVSFAITCFLAFGVFMSLLSDNMPKSSVPVAHLSYFLMYMLIQSCAVTFCTIISLRIYGKMETTDKVPTWLQTFVSLVRLEPCRNRCMSSKRTDVVPSCCDEETPVHKTGVKKIPEAAEYDATERQYMTASANSDYMHRSSVTWYKAGRTFDFLFFSVFLAWMLFTSVSSLMSLKLI